MEVGSLVILGNSLSQEPPAPTRLSNTGRISISACASLSVCVCVCVYVCVWWWCCVRGDSGVKISQALKVICCEKVYNECINLAVENTQPCILTHSSKMEGIL